MQGKFQILEITKHIIWGHEQCVDNLAWMILSFFESQFLESSLFGTILFPYATMGAKGIEKRGGGMLLHDREWGAGSIDSLG
jgi:hypothetical protein